MGVRNGMLYHILGLLSVLAFVYMSFGGLRFRFEEGSEVAFVQRNGTQFVVDGKAFYVNGWNSYWLMFQSVDVDSRHRVREMLKTGAKMGLTVCRTWGFNDGGYHALQTSPGRFDEQAFKVLCVVIPRICTVVFFFLCLFLMPTEICVCMRV